MILVVGGAHSGKRTFVREKLGFAADDFVDAAQLAEAACPRLFAGRVAYRAEELVRALDADRALERLMGFDAVILPLVGSGVVPMRAEDAQWRERAGRWDARSLRRRRRRAHDVRDSPVIKGNLADAPRGTQGAGAPLKVVFVRHGATAGTEDHRYSGAGTDEPPVERGRARFCAISRAMVTCSVLSRAAWPAPTRRRASSSRTRSLWRAPVCARWISATSRGETPPSLKRMCATAPG